MRKVDILLVFPLEFPRNLANCGITAHISEIVSGICDVALQHEGWSVRTWACDRLRPSEFRRRWRRDTPAGAIVIPVDHLRDGPFWNLDAPVVTLILKDGPLPTVWSDHEAIGRLAAQHLRAPGWTPLLVGTTNEPWWQQRCQGFRAVWSAGEAFQYQVKQTKQMRQWMMSLPSRTAIFADQDQTAVLLANTAMFVGRTFGSDLRLLGVDDQIICRMSQPAISSIRLPWRAMGRRAALMLAQRLRNEPVPHLIEVPPAGVAARSTCGSMPEDDMLLGAISRSIYRAVEAGSQQRLEAIIGPQTTCLRTVERAWKRATGATLMQSLQRIRCDLALRLLGSGMDDLDAIARTCGCGSRQNLRRMLRQYAGLDSEKLDMLIDTQPSF